MGLTTLLTMAVVLTVVSQQMPKTSTGLPEVGEQAYHLFETNFIHLIVCLYIPRRLKRDW